MDRYDVGFIVATALFIPFIFWIAFKIWTTPQKVEIRLIPYNNIKTADIPREEPPLLMN